MYILLFIDLRMCIYIYICITIDNNDDDHNISYIVQYIK